MECTKITGGGGEEGDSVWQVGEWGCWQVNCRWRIIGGGGGGWSSCSPFDRQYLMYLRPLGLIGPVPIVHPILREIQIKWLVTFWTWTVSSLVICVLLYRQCILCDRNSIQGAPDVQFLWPQKKERNQAQEMQPLVMFLGRVGTLTILFYPEQSEVFFFNEGYNTCKRRIFCLKVCSEKRHFRIRNAFHSSHFGKRN